MHAKRKNTVHSHKHSFTPYSLSPYSRTDKITDRETNTLAAHGLEEPFFQLCCCVSDFCFLVGDRFRCYIKTCCAWAGEFFFPVMLFCQFLVLAGNKFWFYILTYLEYNTVVALC
jgi:hypothetical protein